MSGPCFIGVDVGTASARAGIFDRHGTMLGQARRDIALFTAPGDIAEQSSEDIWQAVAASVREALAVADTPPGSVAGIGFDATCSLVVVGSQGEALPVGDSAERNIIVWMDHRALEQARRINATGHRVLDYVGGTISPEMETPKLLWLKENRPETFAAAWQFFDLADYLTWRATGSLVRSTCTLTCKWTYVGHERRWDPSYFHAVGLGELADEGFARIGTSAVPGGTRIEPGLSAAAAADFGLPTGIAVGAGLIDAHAGGLGTVGARGLPGDATNRMAYVMGTSACTMTSSTTAHAVPGIWGPYHSAMVPGLWLNEGGQSAAGAAIDHLVRCHPAHNDAAATASRGGTSLPTWLAAQALAAGGAAAIPRLVGGFRVVPDFLGNRSPFADPDAKGLIAGLSMDASFESLLGLYLAGLAALGYGVRQIITAQARAGLDVRTMVVSGGAARTPLVRQILADTTGLAVAAVAADEPVLLGAAMLGAMASGLLPDAAQAMSLMSECGEIYHPDPQTAAWHQGRFADFELLQATARQFGP